MWKLFVESGLWPTYLFELIAAVAGLWYLVKIKPRSPEERFLPYFLILIFLLDFFGLFYAMYGHLYDFRYVEFIKDTAFVSHFWISNCMVLFLTTGYVYFYLLILKGTRIKFLLKILFTVFILASIYAFATSGFFDTINSYSYIFGGFLICIAVVSYFLEMLQSDKITQFYKDLTFYVSVGLLIYYLSITPIYIYQSFVQTSSEYWEIYNVILKSLNFFLYSMFTIGFIVQYRWRKGSKQKENRMEAARPLPYSQD